jgi:hypothetical protein
MSSVPGESTVNNPQSGLSQIEQFLKVTDFCGDGRAVIPPNSFPRTEQVLKVTGLQGSGGCSLSGLSAVHPLGEKQSHNFWVWKKVYYTKISVVNLNTVSWGVQRFRVQYN